MTQAHLETLRKDYPKYSNTQGTTINPLLAALQVTLEDLCDPFFKNRQEIAEQALAQLLEYIRTTKEQQ